MNNTPLTFLYYPFPVVLEFVNWRDLKVLTVKKIAATKAYALGRQATLKDYIDLYFILKDRHAELKEIISLTE